MGYAVAQSTVRFLARRPARGFVAFVGLATGLGVTSASTATAGGAVGAVVGGASVDAGKMGGMGGGGGKTGAVNLFSKGSGMQTLITPNATTPTARATATKNPRLDDWGAVAPRR